MKTRSYLNLARTCIKNTVDQLNLKSHDLSVSKTTVNNFGYLVGVSRRAIMARSR